MDIKRGRLIVLDGPDGSGKATQTDKTYKSLVKRGYDVEVLDFPQYGKNIFADTVKGYLSGSFGDPVKVDPYLASFPYMLDRFVASSRICDGLKRGRIFLANR